LPDCCLADHGPPTALACRVFLSRGYFGSKNCLREVVASVHKKKPIVLVWEPEVSKGGASILSLKAELYEKTELIASLGSTPGECEEYIFRTSQADGRPTVPWFRVYEFQRKSLVMIAQAALVSTPAYIKKRELQMYISDAVSVSNMTLTEYVCLYTSPLNPGAAEAVRELATALVGLATTKKPPPGGDVVELELPTAFGSSHMSRKQSSKKFTQEVHEPTATHFVLYLSTKTFTGEAGLRFAEQVRQMRKQNVPCLMIHENDPERNGCEFGTFFTTTPQDLIDNGIYSALAVNFSWGVHRQVSLGIAAKAIGAVKQKKHSLRAQYKSRLQRQMRDAHKRAQQCRGQTAAVSSCTSADEPPPSPTDTTLDAKSEADAAPSPDSDSGTAGTAPPINNDSGFAAQLTPAGWSMRRMVAQVPEGSPPVVGRVALRRTGNAVLSQAR